MTGLTAAFKCSEDEVAYFFMGSQYVKDKYEASTGKENVDKVSYGPASISAFPSLKGTVFADKIDCAFSSRNSGEAYIFSGNQCGIWKYPTDNSTEDVLLKSATPIGEMFPSLLGTVFEDSVNAAFDSTISNEAYLFKDDQYALISFGPDWEKIQTGSVDDSWTMFKGSKFAGGKFDAALSYCTQDSLQVDVYFFKGESCARVKFVPYALNQGRIVDGLKGVLKIKDVWKDLSTFLPKTEADDDVSSA